MPAMGRGGFLQTKLELVAADHENIKLGGGAGCCSTPSRLVVAAADCEPYVMGQAEFVLLLTSCPSQPKGK